ncbi:MAG: hypothetical protein K1060chlam3_00502 [Candidatus Anoxychlamydiales bacterium]|nr:hypothetical protein [Candidatus Anoxychlamydiales bacterium]
MATSTDNVSHIVQQSFKKVFDKVMKWDEAIGIDKVSQVVQWPLMWIPLYGVIKWRNSGSSNIAKRLTTSIACLGIAFVTVAASIAKLAFGIICFIPPFTLLSLTLFISTAVFESQVFMGSLKTATRSLFHKKVNEFHLDLM